MLHIPVFLLLMSCYCAAALPGVDTEQPSSTCAAFGSITYLKPMAAFEADCVDYLYIQCVALDTEYASHLLSGECMARLTTNDKMRSILVFVLEPASTHLHLVRLMEEVGFSARWLLQSLISEHCLRRLATEPITAFSQAIQQRFSSNVGHYLLNIRVPQALLRRRADGELTMDLAQYTAQLRMQECSLDFAVWAVEKWDRYRTTIASYFSELLAYWLPGAFEPAQEISIVQQFIWIIQRPGMLPLEALAGIDRCVVAYVVVKPNHDYLKLFELFDDQASIFNLVEEVVNTSDYDSISPYFILNYIDHVKKYPGASAIAIGRLWKAYYPKIPRLDIRRTEWNSDRRFFNALPIDKLRASIYRLYQRDHKYRGLVMHSCMSLMDFAVFIEVLRPCNPADYAGLVGFMLWYLDDALKEHYRQSAYECLQMNDSNRTIIELCGVVMNALKPYQDHPTAAPYPAEHTPLIHGAQSYQEAVPFFTQL